MGAAKGQTNHDTRAADHTLCFYCHQQLLLSSARSRVCLRASIRRAAPHSHARDIHTPASQAKIICVKDAHGCAIRICETCVKRKKKVAVKKDPA
jgi:hypothetical protein